MLLCAPPIFRARHAEACVKAGKHIFAEKPIATDPAGLRHFLQVINGEARPIIDAADALRSLEVIDAIRQQAA